jgi:hypothetical protein
MRSARARLYALTAPGGRLEVRRRLKPWTTGPEFAELAARLTPLEWDVLAFLDGHKVEIAADDFSAQDVPVASVARYFGLNDDEFSAVVEALTAEGLAEARGDFVGLTVTGVRVLASRPR